MTTKPPSYEEIEAVIRRGREVFNYHENQDRVLSMLESLLADNVRLRADIRSMVEKAAAGSLGGYRELGERVANAENGRDQLRARIVEIEAERDRWIGESEVLHRMCREKDERIAALEKLAFS